MQLKIIKFNDDFKSPEPLMINRDNSPLSPYKKRPLGESTGSGLKKQETFNGFTLKGTDDARNIAAALEVTAS